jgi:hypothetical protein
MKKGVEWAARLARARICLCLWSQGIDSKESTSPAYVAWRAGTTNSVVVPARQAENRFLGSLKDLQIRALAASRRKFKLRWTGSAHRKLVQKRLCITVLLFF